MTVLGHAESPLGTLLLSGDGEALTGLWFLGQKYEGAGLPENAPTDEGLPENAPTDEGLPVFETARAWLRAYFAGEALPELPPLRPAGTDFQKAVWQRLLAIPYGERRTYGGLAGELETILGRRTSARAVGSAVGRNPISLMIPCHRVVGSGGSLTGYAGGVERKAFLLALEGEDHAG